MNPALEVRARPTVHDFFISQPASRLLSLSFTLTDPRCVSGAVRWSSRWSAACRSVSVVWLRRTKPPIFSRIIRAHANPLITSPRASSSFGADHEWMRERIQALVLLHRSSQQYVHLLRLGGISRYSISNQSHFLTSNFLALVQFEERISNFLLKPPEYGRSKMLHQSEESQESS